MQLKHIGRYEVLDVIGRGECGVVYRAQDPISDEIVAIKLCEAVADSDDTTDADGRRRNLLSLFYNEIRTAGVLDHPHIVLARDASNLDGRPYLVMEFIEGGTTLRRYCDVEQLLPIEQVARIILACADALDHAHRRGVIHRDIKPTNILLTHENQPKICDFGIARLQTSDRTEISGILGTPLYMAPEQIQEDTLSAETDLYSLGVVFYQLLSGRTPFQANQLPQLVDKILRQAPPAIDELRQDLPTPLPAIVHRLLEKNPRDRYNSGRELATDLAAVFLDLHAATQDADEDSKFALVRSTTFFDEFTDAELHEVIHVAHWVQLTPDSQSTFGGTTDLSFCVLLAGSLDVLKDGRRVARLKPGDCFGEAGYLDCARQCSTQAHEDATLISIDAMLIERTSSACQTRFKDAFIRALIERLGRAEKSIIEGEHKNVVRNWQRLARGELAPIVSP